MASAVRRLVAPGREAGHVGDPTQREVLPPTRGPVTDVGLLFAQPGQLVANVGLGLPDVGDTFAFGGDEAPTLPRPLLLVLVDLVVPERVRA